MIYHLKELRIGSLVLKVQETVTIPPDVLEFRDAEGNVLGRIINIDVPQLPRTAGEQHGS